MPTTRPRHVITESDAVTKAIDDAAKRWPDLRDNRAGLLRKLVEEGHQAVLAQRQDAESAHRQAVTRTSGALTGLYGEGYLDALREDWPE